MRRFPHSCLVPQATIDQVSGLITFKAAAEPLAQWDRNIAGICGTLNSITDEAAAKGLLPVEGATA